MSVLLLYIHNSIQYKYQYTPSPCKQTPDSDAIFSSFFKMESSRMPAE